MRGRSHRTGSSSDTTDIVPRKRVRSLGGGSVPEEQSEQRCSSQQTVQPVGQVRHRPRDGW